MVNGVLARAQEADVAVLRRLQGRTGHRTVIAAARGLSRVGEHCAGWLVAGLVGATVDAGRRRDWLLSTAGVVAAHALAIAVKPIIGRPRPRIAGVRALVSTPSQLSCPSSHAASTTAAALLFGSLTRLPLVPVLVPPMAFSRVVLGVHYPSDVALGAALGAIVGRLVRHRLPAAGTAG